MTNPHNDSEFAIKLRALVVAFALLVAFVALVAFVSFGTDGGMIFKAMFSSANRATSEEEFKSANHPTIEVAMQQLQIMENAIHQFHIEFVELNPNSLEGWNIRQPSSSRKWLSWEKDGIAYYDKNGDGQPDMKYRESPRMSTTEFWWEDKDFNGTFETKVEPGCFHNADRPLQPVVNVPFVPVTGQAPKR